MSCGVCMVVRSQKTQCNPGYQVDPNDNNQCTDVNECASNPCGAGVQCTNTPGSYTCQCKTEVATVISCSCPKSVVEDIDECKSSPCHHNATCTNTLGSYQCDCNAGFNASASSTRLHVNKACEGEDSKSQPHCCVGHESSTL
ncbi:adhesion G protein-coupled receptor E1-like [Leucoraja erinacea]|uniref:adhesion G protein-coupled receptor E1-like n=1 Tax=Leucoraja erinaceus TaxID=7782 RepID=UPI002457E7D0|nr:adhesion G protein-coupled receptor E1-like [Leucoraja erinacea]